MLSTTTVLVSKTTGLNPYCMTGVTKISPLQVKAKGTNHIFSCSSEQVQVMLLLPTGCELHQGRDICSQLSGNPVSADVLPCDVLYSIQYIGQQVLCSAFG